MCINDKSSWTLSSGKHVGNMSTINYTHGQYAETCNAFWNDNYKLQEWGVKIIVWRMKNIPW